MDEEYLAAVLDVVLEVPPGRATTYGTVAAALHADLGRGGPRQVGAVLALAGSAVPWWRVVDASGRPPARHRTTAVARLRADGCPLTGEPGAERVHLRAALWVPDAPEAPGRLSASRDGS